MADGSVKAIEDVQVGDWVWAEDPETGEKGARQVTDLIVGSGEKELVRILIDGHLVTATDNHPFWVESKQAWVDAADLVAGDVVLTAAGDTLTIDDVTGYTLDVSAVHNLTVADLHTYYVLAGESSVLVHNTSLAVCETAKARDNYDAIFPQNEWSSNPHLAGETPLSGTRGTGVKRAAKLEVNLVKQTGKGTVKWTPEEIAFIKTEGRLPPGTVGHHINDVNTWADWAGDPRNVRFVRGQVGNLAEHGGAFQNPTTGALIDREAMLQQVIGGPS